MTFFRTREVPQLEQRERLARVEIGSDFISLTNAAGMLETLVLREIRTVRASILRYGKGGIYRYLEIHAVRRLTVPFFAQGFAKLLAVMEQWPDFDTRALAEARITENRGQIRLWMREPAINTHILPAVPGAVLSEELQSGWVLLSHDQGASERVVPWEMTYEQVSSVPTVLSRQNEFGARVLELGPVRILGLRMDALRMYWPKSRIDVPVEEWSCYAVVSQGWDQNYWNLKSHLDQALGEASPGSYERTDQNSLRWERDGLVVGLVYWYDTASHPESGYCWFSVTNRREYPACLNDAYTTSLRSLPARGWASRVYALKDVLVEGNFRKSPWVRSTPQGIRDALIEGATWAVWRDEESGMVGFSTSTFSVILPQERASRLLLQNVGPGRGTGWAELMLEDTLGRSVKVGETSYGAFDSMMEELSTFMALPFLVQPETQDY
jgi:hypothetical protein